MHLLILLAAPYFQFEATYLHTSMQLVICYSQHHIVHRGSRTVNKAAANSRIAAAILVRLCYRIRITKSEQTSYMDAPYSDVAWIIVRRF